MFVFYFMRVVHLLEQPFQILLTLLLAVHGPKETVRGREDDMIEVLSAYVDGPLNCILIEHLQFILFHSPFNKH